MAESTVKNIRAPQETFDRLKALTDEHFPNQGAALEALLNSWEVQAAKGAIPNRETDIADFDSHIQALNRAFIHSLEIAQNADARARDSFRQKIEALETDKAELRQKLEKAEAEKRTAQHQQENARNSAIDANARADTAERHAATLESALKTEKVGNAAQLEDKEKLISSLTAQLAEALEKVSDAEEAAKKSTALKEELAKARRALGDAQTAAQVAEAKAIAAQAQAVAAAQKEASETALRMTNENAALKVQLAEAKTQITKLEAQVERMLSTPAPAEADAANAAPMGDQPTPSRKKATAKK